MQKTIWVGFNIDLLPYLGLSSRSVCCLERAFIAPISHRFAATTANKVAAMRHIQEEVDANSARPTGGKPGGTRHDYALKKLFELRPEVAFLLSDGNATASDRGGKEIPEKELLDIVEAGGQNAAYSPRIHTIYYVTGSDKRSEERMLRALSRKTGGKFDKVKAAPRR